jgi:hypothetical protein
MGRTFDHQEIINTPEAKGARFVSATRGCNLNLRDLRTRIGTPLATPRSVPHGRAQLPDDYAWLKSKAASDPAAINSSQLLQSDPQAADNVNAFQSRRSSPRLTADFAGLDDANWTPPNAQIAAGPDQLLVAVNSALAVFDRSGAQLLRCRLEEMFAALIGEAEVFNPKVLYDQFRNGWILTTCARNTETGQAWMLLAISRSANPLGDWWLWALDAGADGAVKTPYWTEGVGLAVDDATLYLTANMFNGQGQFVYAKLRVLSKKELLLGGMPQGWDFWQLRNADGSPAFGLQPALNLRAAGAQYLLNATSDGQGVTQWTLTQASRQSYLLARRFVPTTPYGLAPNARQTATNRELETGDTRLTNVIFRHGMLWAAHTVAAHWDAGSSVAAIHWLQINPRAGCVMQQGIYGAPHHHYFCPATMVDGEGNLLLAFNRASQTQAPSLRFTARCAPDAPNQLQASAELQRSLVIDVSDWSMTNGVAVAPNESEIWIIGQYAPTAHDWATWIGAVTYAEAEDTNANGYEQRLILV